MAEEAQDDGIERSVPGAAGPDERRDLAVDPVPIDLAGEPNQIVLHVDDAARMAGLGSRPDATSGRLPVVAGPAVAKFA